MRKGAAGVRGSRVVQGWAMPMAIGEVCTDVRSRKMNENGTLTGEGDSLGQKDPSEPAGHSALTPAVAFGEWLG